jgi:bla regulator protein BlaR1
MMEIFGNIIPEPFLYALGWMIIHAIWQIAGIGLLLWLGLRLFNQKNAAFKYRLGLAALVLIFFLAVLTFSYHFDNVPGIEKDAVLNTQWAYLAGHEDLIGQTAFSQKASPFLISKRIEQYIPTLVNFWIIGVFLFFFKTASGLAELRNLHRKNHKPVPERLYQLVQKLNAQLNITKPIKILSSCHIDLPVTYGYLKPVILIPTALMLQMNPKQLEAIITHELAHIKRQDYLVNLIQSCLEMFFFFHPVFWWINQEIKKQREIACDEIAVALGVNPKDLAHGLANVVNYAQKNAPELTLAAAKKATPTLDRIKKIMGVKPCPSQPTTLTTITMIITLILGASLLVGASDRTTKSDEDFLLTKSSLASLDLHLPFHQYDEKKDTVPEPKTPPSPNAYPLPELPPEALDILSKGLEPLKEMGMIFKELDFDWGDFSNMPHLELMEIPMPNFNFEHLPKWDIDPDLFNQLLADSTFKNMPQFQEFYWEDSTSSFKVKLANKSQMSKEEWAQLRKEQKEQLAKWKENHAEQLEAWKIERIAKTEEWRNSYKPQIEEFKEKMKEWENENQPKIEEFQQKMEEWQKANEEKMKVFQEKMEAWQKEHEAEMKAFEQKFKDSQKKEN